MQVIDITHKAIKEFAIDTMEKIQLTETEEINLIGIAEGGLPITDIFEKELLERNIKLNRIDIKCRRPSTKKKKNSAIISSSLKYLPTSMLNLLRVIEHHILSKSRNPEREIILLNQSKVDNLSKMAKTIVIDDAIDSGFSLSFVKNFFHQLVDEKKLYFVVIVCTQKNPVFHPDFFLLDNVLVRFPWSLDAKH